jgi:hypothetical protein
MVVQDVDTRLPGYSALEYGDLHPDQVTYPGLKLVYQAPLDQQTNYMWVRRVYAKDRQEQDAYNFTLKYSASDPAYPIYIRTYVVSRSEYAPLPAGSPDPIFPSARLIAEEVERFRGDGQLTGEAEDKALDSVYLKVSRVYETLPGPFITRYESNEVGQKVQVTSQRKFLGEGYSSPNPSSVTSFTSEIGEGNVITDTVKTLPEVFSGKAFSVEAPDPAPTKFRVKVPAITTEQTVAGTASQPTLTTGEFAKSETQQTGFTNRKRTTYRPTFRLPTALSQKATTEQKQLATITETLQNGDTSETPSATVDVESEALGDGTYVVRKTIVPDVFSAKTFSVEAPDTAPAKFRVASPTTTEEETIAGTTAVKPVLGAGEFAKSETQQTKFTIRKRTTSRQTTPKSLTQKATTPNKQVATITETLQNGDTSETPSATVDVESEALGDGMFVVRKTIIPEVFSATTETKSKPDVLPPRFVAKIESVAKTDVKAGTDSTVTLAANQLSASKQRISKFEVRESTVTRDDTTTPELTGHNLDEAYNIQIPYTEKISSSGAKVANSDIEPLSADKYLVRTYDTSALSSVLSGYMVEYPTRISLDLPRVMTRLEVIFAKSESGSDFNNQNAAIGRFMNLNQSDTGSLAISSTLTPEFKIQYRDIWASNIEATNHIFFLQKPVTSASILAKLGASKWPIFKPEGAVITAQSKTLTKRISAAVSRACNFGDTTGASYGLNDTVEESTDTKPIIVTIPPCLHGGFNLNTTDSTNQTKTFTISYPAMEKGGVTVAPMISINRTLNLNLVNQVQQSLPATNPVSIPTSGRFLTDCRVDFFKHDWFVVHATVFDAATLA